VKVGNDGTATVSGTVLENIKKCTVDLKCYLLLKKGDEEIRVIYGSGEGSNCLNDKATDAGFQVKKGQKINAYGSYGKLGKRYIISTCSSNDFYIKVLP
jgi:hypothetical protein